MASDNLLSLYERLGGVYSIATEALVEVASRIVHRRISRPSSPDRRQRGYRALRDIYRPRVHRECQPHRLAYPICPYRTRSSSSAHSRPTVRWRLLPHPFSRQTLLFLLYAFAANLCCETARFCGISIRKCAPENSSEATSSTEPSWAWIHSSTTDNPMPVPPTWPPCSVRP